MCVGVCLNVPACLLLLSLEKFPYDGVLGSVLDTMKALWRCKYNADTMAQPPIVMHVILDLRYFALRIVSKFLFIRWTLLGNSLGNISADTSVRRGAALLPTFVQVSSCSATIFSSTTGDPQVVKAIFRHTWYIFWAPPL